MYREFKFDANEVGGAGRLLSLDKLEIWQEESGSLTGFTSAGSAAAGVHYAGGPGFAGTHTDYLAYNLDEGGDHWIAIDSGLSSGSGKGDMRVYIPDSYFINDAAHRYVTLFSQFGAQGGSYSASGGFEEWGVNSTSAGSGNTASFLMTKTALVADGGNADNAGDVINYTIKLSNVGNVALTGVTVTDPLLQGPNATLSGPSGDSNANAVLDVGEVWTYSGTYTVQQSDIDNFGQGDGSIDNTATADTAQTTAQSASASVLVELHPSIALVKAAVGHFTDLNENGMVDPGETKFFDDANFNGRVDAGETIDYDFTVMNDGNVTIQNINVSDLVGGVAVSGGPITLGPGQSDSSTFNGTYTVTQADIDAGFFDNTARATGTFTEGNDIELI